MTSNRNYRGKPSRPIPVWNGILEHFEAMGMAIWLFLWCLDKITREQDSLGHVLGGAPVKIEQIANDLGRSQRALRRDLKVLRSRYLKLRWTPYGYVIHVVNSRKFGIWKSRDSPAKSGEARDKSGQARAKSGQAETENGRSKEDSAVAAGDTAVKQQSAASNLGSVWSFLGINQCGPTGFRNLLEDRWASRKGDPTPVLIGEAIDAWEKAEGDKLRGAPQLFAALKALRDRERRNVSTQPAEPIHTFSPEEIPA